MNYVIKSGWALPLSLIILIVTAPGGQVFIFHQFNFTLMIIMVVNLIWIVYSLWILKRAVKVDNNRMCKVLREWTFQGGSFLAILIALVDILRNERNGISNVEFSFIYVFIPFLILFLVVSYFLGLRMCEAIKEWKKRRI